MIGMKNDKSKPRASLLPKGTLNAVIRVLEFGATKYRENNWKHVPDAKTRYYDAMHRHIDAWWGGEQKDPETGEHHLAHATCCAMFLMWLDFNGHKNAPETPQAILDAQPSKDIPMEEKCSGELLGACGHLTVNGCVGCVMDGSSQRIRDCLIDLVKCGYLEKTTIYTYQATGKTKQLFRGAA